MTLKQRIEEIVFEKKECYTNAMKVALILEAVAEETRPLPFKEEYKR